MIRPNSLKAQPITGYYETLIHTGGRLKDHRCNCSAPLLPPDPSDGYRAKACMKGESCIHLVSRIMFVLVARHWPVSDIAQLVEDSSNVGLAWLRAQDDEEFYYQHERPLRLFYPLRLPDVHPSVESPLASRSQALSIDIQYGIASCLQSRTTPVLVCVNLSGCCARPRVANSLGRAT